MEGQGQKDNVLSDYPTTLTDFARIWPFAAKAMVFRCCQCPSVAGAVQMSYGESPTLRHRPLQTNARQSGVDCCTDLFLKPLRPQPAPGIVASPLPPAQPGGTSQSLVLPYLCVFSWALQAAGSEKALLHSLQEKGFSPVWIRMCRL